MPIVRTYQDLESMGQMALAAGGAMGRGQAAQQQRQLDNALMRQVLGQKASAASQERSIDANQEMFNLESAFRSQEADRAREGSLTEGQQRFEQQLTRDQIQNKSKIEQNKLDFQQGLLENEQQSKLTGRRQIDVARANEQMEQELGMDQLVRNIVQAGQAASVDEARPMAAKIMVAQQQARGGRGRGGSGDGDVAQDLVGTLGGNNVQRGVMFATQGDIEGGLNAAEIAKTSPQIRIQDPFAATDIEQGMSAAIIRMFNEPGGPQRVEAIWKNTPSDLGRQFIGRVLSTAGVTTHGANQQQQAPGAIQQGTPPGASGRRQAEMLPSGFTDQDVRSRNTQDLRRIEQELMRRLQAAGG